MVYCFNFTIFAFMKKCGKCKEFKSVSMFYKSSNTLSGYQNRCKDCSKDAKKKWSNNNRQHKTDYKKDWDSKNYERNKDYRVKNKEIIKLNARKWYIKNKDIKLEREKKRLKSDTLFKIKHNLRRNIKQSLYSMGYSKNSKSEEILGCSYDFFLNWLGSCNDVNNFHLDHIVPVSLANTEIEILYLNHYSNIQLLTPKENLIKGNKYIKKKNYHKVLKNHPQPNIIKEIVSRSGVSLF